MPIRPKPSIVSGKASAATIGATSAVAVNPFQRQSSGPGWQRMRSAWPAHAPQQEQRDGQIQ
jgi:hypothetical protein